MGWAENDGVRFGLVVPQGWRDDLVGRDFERMVSVAQAAERLGFDSIWVSDYGLGQVRRYDATSADLRATVETRTPEGVLATEDGVWIANHRYGTVSRIDPETNPSRRPDRGRSGRQQRPEGTHRSRR